MSETPETVDNPAAPAEENEGGVTATPEAGDGAEETGHDETGEDNAGAAPESDLPEGGDETGIDGADVGAEGEDPGTALPDDPHNVGGE